jgi:hypothetical protein
MPEPRLEPAVERALAAHLFNRTWDLLLQAERSAADVDEMIASAHASRYHWSRVGTPTNFSRGEWQLARVYAVLGRAEPALFHAGRCLSWCEAHDLGAFDLGCAHEAHARAHAVGGDAERARAHLAKAQACATQVSDEEDRQILLEDLKSVPLS